MFRALIILLLCLPACQILPQGGVARSAASGVAGAWSGQAVIATGRHRVLIGEARVITQGGSPVYLLQIGQRWDGVARPITRPSVWMDRVELPFAPSPRRTRFCVAAGDCLGHSLGAILMSADMFTAAAQQGLQAEVIGTDVTLAISAPPALFSDALARASAAGLL